MAACRHDGLRSTERQTLRESVSDIPSFAADARPSTRAGLERRHAALANRSEGEQGLQVFSAVQQRNVVNNCRLASLDCEGTCLQADAARVAAVRCLRLRPQAALSLRAFDCHRTWRGSCASRTGARVRHAACLRLMAFSQWARSLPLPRFAELVLRRPWLDSAFPRLRGSGPGFSWRARFGALWGAPAPAPPWQTPC